MPWGDEVSRRGVLRTAAAGLTAAVLPAQWLRAQRGGATGMQGLPSADEMMEWIAEIVDHGIRRPAYRADKWVESWAAERFEAFGLEDVRREKVDVPEWDPGDASLRLEPEGPRFTGFPLPHSTPDTVEGELATLTEEPPAGSLTGRIAVFELDPIVLPQSAARGLATSSYDPAGDFETLEQILPFATNFQTVMEPAIDAGAIGFVGLLTGFPWDTRDYYVPYDAIERPIPGVWLSGSDGRELLDLMAAGTVTARLAMEAERSPAVSRNVIGTLPGASDEWVIVASHHDAPWASAVEDGSGIAMVLAQARYWAGVPRTERRHNMLFMLTAGHMVAAAGTEAFIEEHQRIVGNTVLEVHLEHAARRCVGENGELVPTDEPEVRWWFTSESPTLQATVQTALETEDLRRSLVLRPDVFFENPPTDGSAFHAAGVPLVHFLTAPMYLFDKRDTLDKIHEASLEPVARAVIQIIKSTAGVTAAEMRAGVVAS
ncbi:MAG: M28 family peptidase [Acidimicrobiia bacterium]